MKKIIGILLAGALVTSAFAVDFNAKVKMSGDILGGTIDLNDDGKDDSSFNALKLNNGIVDNNDFITTTFTGDKSGAAFNITLDNRAMKIDSAKVWIQPIDMLKITFGQQAWEAWSETTYTYGRMTAWGRSWANESEAPGFDFLITPVGGLEFDVGFKPGWDTPWVSVANEKVALGCWNIGAKVDLNSFVGIPVGILANFKNAVDGENNISQISVGALYGNQWGGGLSAHLVARIGFAKGLDEGKIGNGWGSGSKDKNSMIIDNGVKYDAGTFKVWASVPVLIDLDTDNDDVNKSSTGLGFVVKASYSLDSVTPWVKLSQTDMTVGKFADFKFKPKVELGADFSVGSCSMGISAGATIPGEKENLSWSVPFWATISF